MTTTMKPNDKTKFFYRAIFVFLVKFSLFSLKTAQYHLRSPMRPVLRYSRETGPRGSGFGCPFRVIWRVVLGLSLLWPVRVWVSSRWQSASCQQMGQTYRISRYFLEPLILEGTCLFYLSLPMSNQMELKKKKKWGLSHDKSLCTQLYFGEDK